MGSNRQVQENSTAILLFSQNAEDDYRQKSFGLNYQRFSQVHRTLVNKVRKTISRTGLPLLEADSQIQKGEDFASRLIHAIDWVKAQGYHKLIIVGNDSPGLTVQQLIEAEHAIDQGKPVLGKDIHGGAYLIGLDTEKLDVALLNGIDWHSSRVFDQLMAALCEVELLSEIQADLNGIGDLKRLNDIKSILKSFLRLIRRLILSPHSAEKEVQTLASAIFYTNNLHRGPPALA